MSVFMLRQMAQSDPTGMMDEHLDAVEAEIAALEARVAELTRGWNEASATRHRLLLEVKALDARVTALTAALGALVARLDQTDGLGDRVHRSAAEDGAGWVWYDLTPLEAVPAVAVARAALAAEKGDDHE